MPFGNQSLFPRRACCASPETIFRARIHRRFVKHLFLDVLLGAGLIPCAASGQTTNALLPMVEVMATREHETHQAPPTNASMRVLSEQELASKRPYTSDTAQMLNSVAGVNLQQGGAVSSLPVIHGLNDDRNAISIGGMSITSACGNHMNPPLSYIDPNNVQKIEVLTALIPVSESGDSIGGTIIVTPREPVFATPALIPQAAVTNGEPAFAAASQVPIFSGSLSLFYRSNNKSPTIAGTAAASTEHFAVNYAGSWSKGSDYRAGGGEKILSTNYSAQNHSATFAYRNEDQLLSLRASYQDIPYQGFVNQRMDMLSNQSINFDLAYKGGFDWGRLEGHGYYQRTRHYMNFLADKNSGVDATPTTGMPMYTSGTDFGYTAKADVIASTIDQIRLGSEFHGQELNDWWTPVASSGSSGMSSMSSMMCCSTFTNINNGIRNRLSTYVEWNRQWAEQWSTLVGLRNDLVFMNTGGVQGYNTMMYGADAARFNATGHGKLDVNFDVTALVRFAPDRTSLIEAGYTRKTRSPSLYERYTWSTNAMAAEMNNWSGDGNGYVGNVNLKPEVAHMFSVSALFQDSADGAWEARVTPYYMYVNNYIDVDKRGTLGSGSGQVNLLQFANHDAEIFGVDLSGRIRLFKSGDYGSLALSGIAGYTRGVRLDNGSSLYHMMPMNGKVALEHKIDVLGGLLTTMVEGEAVAAKNNIEAVRLEPTTPAYGLMNFRSSFEFANVRFDFGVENIFDKLYYAPLAGSYVAGYKAGISSPLQTPVAGMGRTFYGGMTVRF
ncbi:TonB-dependent receptor [Beijerinckia mobilis]|uniref:TonB-dependent receptor n=1 Tax=Beijerinckia mobilis TaxID=231434 RepID=UPI000A406CD0|nr:TonB-dependent receptor plug domain-containing protein [Beijerinckia mobilis]